MTWNLERNIEDRLIEIEGKVKVARGNKSLLNFCSASGVFYDLEYNFPANFYGKTDGFKIKRFPFESVISENKECLLMRTNSSLYLSLTVNEIERRFLGNIDTFAEKLTRKPFPVTMIDFRTLEGNNIFHLLVQDFKALKKFQNNYLRYCDTFEDEDDWSKLQEIYLMILYPNTAGVTPFEVALTQSSQFVDYFLKMLANVEEYALSRFIFKDLEIFIELMGMGLPSFEGFLETCLFQTISMKKTQIRFWKHGSDEQTVDANNTSLMQRSFLREFIGRSSKDPEEEELLKD